MRVSYSGLKENIYSPPGLWWCCMHNHWRRRQRQRVNRKVCSSAAAEISFILSNHNYQNQKYFIHRNGICSYITMMLHTFLLVGLRLIPCSGQTLICFEAFLIHVRVEFSWTPHRRKVRWLQSVSLMVGLYCLNFPWWVQLYFGVIAPQLLVHNAVLPPSLHPPLLYLHFFYSLREEQGNKKKKKNNKKIIWKQDNKV